MQEAGEECRQVAMPIVGLGMRSSGQVGSGGFTSDSAWLGGVAGAHARASEAAAAQLRVLGDDERVDAGGVAGGGAGRADGADEHALR